MQLEKRGLLIASLFFGISYVFVRHQPLPDPALIAWKGAGVGLLALYAACATHRLDGWLLTAALGLGALGDMLLEIDLVIGAIAFVGGHIAAIALYRRNRRQALSTSQRALALLVIPAATYIAWVLPADRDLAAGVAFYGLVVAVMASLAWTSRFPRYRVGIGAMLFLLSDLVLFAGMGAFAENALVRGTVWPLYYAGQLLICIGAVRALQGSALTK